MGVMVVSQPEGAAGPILRLRFLGYGELETKRVGLGLLWGRVKKSLERLSQLSRRKAAGRDRINPYSPWVALGSHCLGH